MKRVVSCLAWLCAVLAQPAAVAATQLTDAMSSADYPDYRVGAGGNLYLVRHDANVDSGAILFKAFNAGGTELIPDIQINAGGSGFANTRPVMAIDAGSRLFVAWQNQADQEVYFLRLEPLLDDLDPATPADLNIIKQPNPLADVLISDPNDGRPARNPAMAIDGNGDLHIVWESGAGGPVQYLKVDPDGVPLMNAPVSVSQTAGTIGTGNDLPDIAIDSAGQVHVVYTHAGVTQANEVYYTMLDGDSAKAGTAGTVLIAPTLLTVDDGLYAGNATVSVDLVDDRVYVVYTQATTLAVSGDEQIYLTALSPALDDQDGSVASPAAIRLHETAITGTPAQFSWQVFSRIGSDRRVHAIYMDFDDTTCPGAASYAIRNAHVTYDGKLITTETLTGTGAALSCNPQARLAPRSNRVVWTDSATGDLEIFSATFGRADAGESGFTCSLRNPGAGVAQAGELWLLLAFIAVLWRLRVHRRS
jgi:hypothetical protein